MPCPPAAHPKTWFANSHRLLQCRVHVHALSGRLPEGRAAPAGAAGTALALAAACCVLALARRFWPCTQAAFVRRLPPAVAACCLLPLQCPREITTTETEIVLAALSKPSDHLGDFAALHSVRLGALHLLPAHRHHRRACVLKQCMSQKCNTLLMD